MSNEKAFGMYGHCDGVRVMVFHNINKFCSTNDTWSMVQIYSRNGTSLQYAVPSL